MVLERVGISTWWRRFVLLRVWDVPVFRILLVIDYQVSIVLDTEISIILQTTVKEKKREKSQYLVF